MAHPHLALAILLAVCVAALAVRVGTLLADRGRQVDALLPDGEPADAGVDILPGTWRAADEPAEAPQQPIVGRPALYIVSHPHPHAPKGRHRS